MKLLNEYPNPEYIAYELEDNEGNPITHKGEQVYVVYGSGNASFYTAYEELLAISASGANQIIEIIECMTEIGKGKVLCTSDVEMDVTNEIAFIANKEYEVTFKGEYIDAIDEQGDEHGIASIFEEHFKFIKNV